MSTCGWIKISRNYDNIVLLDLGSLVLFSLNSHHVPSGKKNKQLGESDTCFPGLRKIKILNLNSACEMSKYIIYLLVLLSVQFLQNLYHLQWPGYELSNSIQQLD